MKAIILAFLMFLVYLVLVTITFRLASPNAKRARLMTILFLWTLPVAVALHLLTPADLGFLSPRLAENQPLELAFLLFLYCSAFFGGVLQLYNLTDRGFSLRIAIDIAQSGNAQSAGDVLGSYSAGRGTTWMYQKRLDDLVALRLIEIHGETVVATPRGIRVADRFFWLRRFIKVDGYTG